jgi:hypothetical protein
MCGTSYSSLVAAAGPENSTRAGDPPRRAPLAEALTIPRGAQMHSTHAPKPADEAAEEAIRAVQIALDRRDNGGVPTER